MATISAPAFGPAVEPRVVYRHSKPSWVPIVFNVAFACACFAFACLPLVNTGPPTPEEIAKEHIENMAVVWFAFCGGALLLFILSLELINKLFFYFVADENGLRWRSFFQWSCAHWDEVTDCQMMNKDATPRIFIGKRFLDFESKSTHWPALREIVESRVNLPDDLEFWHQPVVTSAEERRAKTVKTDDGAVLIARSGTGGIAILGVLICGGFAWVLHNDPKGTRPSDFILLAIVGWATLVWPILSQIRDYLIVDDDGLHVGQLFRKRRVLWAEIEDLFLLRKQNKSTVFWKPCVLVAGETIELTPLGKSRDAILNRIEARAIYSQSRQFEKREFTPVGKGLVLPEVLRARLTLGIWLHRNGLLLLTFAGSAAVMAWAIEDIGWENFGRQRGILLWTGGLWALLAGAWLRRAIQKIALRRARGDYRIAVDDAGLSWEQGAVFTRIEWAQIARLERDCYGAWDTILRVETDEGDKIEWDDGLEKCALLATLARERCEHEWHDSEHMLRLQSGMARTGDATIWSENNLLTRMWAALWFGMWALIPSVMFCAMIFDPTATWQDALHSALWLVAPPFGLPLFIVIGAMISMARVRTRCDAQGLIHRGWFKARQICWLDVAEVGIGGGGLFDFVRAHDGRTIRLWLFPAMEASSARHQLRAEIMSRAPDAAGGWKPKE